MRTEGRSLVAASNSTCDLVQQLVAPNHTPITRRRAQLSALVTIAPRALNSNRRSSLPNRYLTWSKLAIIDHKSPMGDPAINEARAVGVSSNRFIAASVRQYVYGRAFAVGDVPGGHPRSAQKFGPH